MSFHGSCLCGGVKFGLKEAPKVVVNCHCSICRGSHGAAFATQALFMADAALEIVSGQDNVSEYESSTGFLRAFCSKCGSHIVNYPKNKNFFSVATNYLEEDLKPSIHIWVGSKAKWYTINDDLPQDEEMSTLKL